MRLYLDKITRQQTVDTGMALTLIALLVGWFTHQPGWYPVAMGVLLITMTFPGVWKPAALVWFKLAEGLNVVSSRIVLTLLFGLLVMPVGLWRRWRGHDPLQLHPNRDETSSLAVREHTWLPADLNKPY